MRIWFSSWYFLMHSSIARFRLLCMAEFYSVWHLHQLLLQVSSMTIICIQWHLSQCFRVRCCMVCIGMLCLAEFRFVWYLHQLLQLEGYGATHDNFMIFYVSNMAFFLILLRIHGVYWTVMFGCIPSHLIPSCGVKVSPLTILCVKSCS